MSKYVDIEPIIRKIKYSMEIGEIRGRIWFEMVLKDLEELPAVDAVEVVRCKDCKYSEPYDGSTKATLRLKCLYRSGVLENWFCEHGEKVTE